MVKKFIYSFIFVGLFFVFNITSKALTYGGCQYSEISRLKSLVSNVNITYDYYIENNKAYFNITLSNITPGMYFVDSKTGNSYNYYNTNDGEITLYSYYNTNGYFKFYSALDLCYGTKLSNKYYSLPTYNYYYTDPLCQENQNYSLCQKWANVNYSYTEFEKFIYEHNKKEEIDTEDKDIEVVYEKTYLDMFVKFYTQYYYFILIGIIVICVVIMIISRRKNRFDL